MIRVFLLILTAALAENFLFSRGVGTVPELLMAKSLRHTLETGGLLTAAMTLACLLTGMTKQWILVPLGADYLETLAALLLTAAVIGGGGWLCGRISGLSRAWNRQTPWLTLNGVAAAAALTVSDAGYSVLSCALYGVAGGVGLILASLLMQAVLPQLDAAEPPRAFRGLPLLLLSVGLIAMIFAGITGRHF